MKRKLLAAMLLGSLGLCAQTTHHINWFMNVTEAAASMTIETGDTVEWTWTDALPHTVTSSAGSTESFDSGQLTGNGQTFSHVFTMEGINPYSCEVHPMMEGTITVEDALGVEEVAKAEFEFFPNPVTDVLTINAKKTIDSIEIYDMNGRRIMNSKGGNTVSKIYMDNYPAGTYLVNVKIGSAVKTINVVKI